MNYADKTGSELACELRCINCHEMFSIKHMTLTLEEAKVKLNKILLDDHYHLRPHHDHISLDSL
jgi:hypothetical protein